MFVRSPSTNSVFSSGPSRMGDYCDIFSSLENEPFSALILSSDFGSPPTQMTTYCMPTAQGFSQAYYWETAALNVPRYSNFDSMDDISKENSFHNKQLNCDSARKRLGRDDYRFLKRYKCTERISIGCISEESVIDLFANEDTNLQQEYNKQEYNELFRVPKNDIRFNRFFPNGHERSCELEDQSADIKLPKWQTTSTGCKCKHSKCLKSYCSCFKHNLHCNPMRCRCVTCSNKEDDPLWKSVIRKKDESDKDTELLDVIQHAEKDSLCSENDIE